MDSIAPKKLTVCGLLFASLLMACAAEPPRRAESQPGGGESAPGGVSVQADDDGAAWGESCGIESWRRTARAVVFVPEHDLLVSRLTAYSAQTGKRRWSQEPRFTEDEPVPRRANTRILPTFEGRVLQAFAVHDGVVLYADDYHAGTADVRTGEAISIVTGFGSFEVAWDPEVIQRGTITYSADGEGVTVTNASRSDLIADARLLACDAHDLLVLVNRDGEAQAIARDGTRRPMAPVPTPDRIHRLYSSGGVVKAAIADGADIRADGFCWKADEHVGELVVTPFGVAGMEYDPTVSWRHHDDPTYLRRFAALVFFPFPEKRDVAQCRWVTTVPRLRETRPMETR